MSVSKTPDGKWRVQIWYLDWRGERHHKCKRGFERKKDAELWERRFRNLKQTETITMDKLVEEYINDATIKCKLGSIKEITLEAKNNFVDWYIRDYFSGVDAKTIKTADINVWLNETQSKGRNSKPLSSSTMKNIRNVLSQIFDYGIKNSYLQENPVLNSEIVSTITVNKRASIWSIEDYSKFYNSIFKESYRVLFNLMFFGGLRIGEAIVLTKADINGNKLSIVKTLNRGRKKIITTKKKPSTPKTKSSNREVVIPQKLVEQLNAYIDSIPYLKPTDKIFKMSATSAGTYLTRRIERLKLPYISPHNLRHSYASMLLAETKNPAIVAHQLGHANPRITLQTYSHMLPNANVAAVDFLNDFIK